jgi:hypothetical protein
MKYPAAKKTPAKKPDDKKKMSPKDAFLAMIGKKKAAPKKK